MDSLDRAKAYGDYLPIEEGMGGDVGGGATRSEPRSVPTAIGFFEVSFLSHFSSPRVLSFCLSTLRLSPSLCVSVFSFFLFCCH